MKFNWKFQEGREGSNEKTLAWGTYGYFLESSIDKSRNVQYLRLDTSLRGIKQKKIT